MMNTRLAALFGVAALALLTSAPAWAGCSTSGSTATCTGSDLDSISYSQSDGIDEIDVKSLTADVGGATALSLSEVGTDGSGDGDDGSAASSATVTFTGTNGSDTYGISGATDTSVTVTSTGGAGHDGYEQETTHNPVGGDGGDGAAAGDASYTMTGGFVTQSAGDSGIVVSSTGGAGATGGEGRAENNETEETTATGGNGGTGGVAGAATLSLSDLSNPDGSAGIDLSGVATGISVASTGGDGGQGGEAFCNQAASIHPCKAYSGIGGEAGAGGDATATITDTDVSITDVSATGIEVLSTGGTGGQGGTGKTKTDFGRVEDFPTKNDYGKGGTGGDAATASLELDSSGVTITDTSGQATYGIRVSSAGGQGGEGNESQAAGSGEHPGFGNGGDGGNGGPATLTLVGSTIAATVSAGDAVAVLVKSTGGDGGSIGPSAGSWADDADDGTTGGAGGAAGAVSVSMDSNSALNVTTSGDGGSMGALTLISQGGDGGGGGTGGYYGSGYGGDGGDGGRVTGTATTILAKTSGDDGYGVLLKSLGGDGGNGAASDGDGGDGDPIDISISSASVTTTGEGSHGIVAISQGGKGANTSGGGDGGDGDWVTLHVDGGTIQVSGADAYGIYAASLAGAAGSGNAGDTADAVKVITGAEVTVSGSGGIGLYAASTGDTTNGEIDVTVDSGGTITASGSATAAVSIVDGDTNTLTNNGTITTDDLPSLSIYALMSSGAELAVTNNGIFSGSVALDDYANSFANSSGATLNLGASFDLGSSGTLTNDGTLSPGGEGTVLSSTVTGVVTQSSDGVYLVDVSGSSTDELVFETAGTTLAGTVSVNMITSPSTSSGSIIAQSNAGSIDASGLVVSDTATVDYSLDTSNSTAVTLDWDVNASNSALQAQANANQSSTANHLQQILEGGGTLGVELSQLLNIVSVEDYLAALDTLASQVSSDGQLTALMSNMQFSDALLSCADYAGAYRFVSQDQCAWLKFGVIRSERDGSSANRPFDQTAAQFAGGAQFQIAEDWHVGGGFSVEKQWLTVDDIAESQGTFYQGGLVTKRSFGNTIVSASLSGGYGSFDITRALAPMGVATGTEPLWTVSGQLSASHAFTGGGPWYIKPRADLAFDHVVMEGYTEHGAGGASLTFEESAETYVSVQPAVEIGGELNVGKGLLIRPSLSVGLTRFLTDAAPSVQASFADTPAGVAPFTTGSDFDKTYVDVKGGVEILSAGAFTALLQGFGQFSQNTTSYGGSAKLAVRF